MMRRNRRWMTVYDFVALVKEKRRVGESQRPKSGIDNVVGIIDEMLAYSCIELVAGIQFAA